MQPDIKEKTKDNSEGLRENKKNILPVQEWDQAAFHLIRQELAPKGFSEIKRGPWRGKVQSNIPFLPKSSVDRCQKIGAQLVRSYRDKVRQELEGKLKDLEAQMDKRKSELAACNFWQLRKKADLNRKVSSALSQSLTLAWAIGELDKIGVK